MTIDAGLKPEGRQLQEGSKRPSRSSCMANGPICPRIPGARTTTIQIASGARKAAGETLRACQESIALMCEGAIV